MNGGVYETGAVERPMRNIFAVLVDNEPGVLARVIGLFSGRGYNIESLTVDEVDQKSHLSRITIVTNGSPMIISQIKAQLGRLVPVRQVVNLTEQGGYVESCMALVKVVGDAAKHAEAIAMAESCGARVVDKTDAAIVFEVTGAPEKVNVFVQKLASVGAVEVARTGSVAMACDEAVWGLSAPTADRKSA